MYICIYMILCIYPIYIPYYPMEFSEGLASEHIYQIWVNRQDGPCKWYGSSKLWKQTNWMLGDDPPIFHRIFMLCRSSFAASSTQWDMFMYQPSSDRPEAQVWYKGIGSLRTWRLSSAPPSVRAAHLAKKVGSGGWEDEFLH